MTEANILIEDIASTDASKVIKQVSVTGQLDESNIDEKAQAIYQLITQTPKGLNLFFDFEKLEYMNSKSIGYLTDWYGKVTEGGGHIVIIKAKPNILDILSVIGLTQLIPMFSSVDEAKFSLLNPTPTPVGAVPVSTTPAPVTSAPVISTPNAPTVASVPAPTPTPVAVPPPVVVAPAPVTPVVDVAPTVSAPAPVTAPAPVAPTPVPTPTPTPVAPTQTPVVAQVPVVAAPAVTPPAQG